LKKLKTVVVAFFPSVEAVASLAGVSTSIVTEHLPKMLLFSSKLSLFPGPGHN